MYVSVLILLISLALVIIGAQWLVIGSSDLAKRLKVPSIFIGFTVVAFGTSLPELSVNMFSIKNNETTLALGNIIGSNIANIGLIIGITALLSPLLVRSSTIRREMPLMFMALFVTTVLSADKFLNGDPVNILARGDGILLLTLFAIFGFAMLMIMLGVHAGKIERPKYSLAMQIIYIIAGLAGLIYGGKFVVTSALEIIDAVGISSAFAGILIVAIGTSLPELATSVVATLKKQADIAVGNIVGSNLFNTAMILGLASVIKPIEIPDDLIIDMVLMTLFGILLFITVLGRDKKIEKWEGAFLLSAYIGYVILVFMRG